jgi:hypothetical protein
MNKIYLLVLLFVLVLSGCNCSEGLFINKKPDIQSTEVSQEENPSSPKQEVVTETPKEVPPEMKIPPISNTKITPQGTKVQPYSEPNIPSIPSIPDILSKDYSLSKDYNEFIYIKPWSLSDNYLNYLPEIPYKPIMNIEKTDDSIITTNDWIIAVGGIFLVVFISIIAVLVYKKII